MYAEFSSIGFFPPTTLPPGRGVWGRKSREGRDASRHTACPYLHPFPPYLSHLPFEPGKSPVQGALPYILIYPVFYLRAKETILFCGNVPEDATSTWAMAGGGVEVFCPPAQRAEVRMRRNVPAMYVTAVPAVL